MKVTLLTHTPNPEKVIAMAANICYSSAEDVDKLAETMTEDKVKKLVKGILSSGHTSVLEHVSFTFAIEGVSRALLAQLSRHRIGVSLSCRSQRYISEDQFNFVVPQSLVPRNDERLEYIQTINKIKKTYDDLVESGVKKEDARMILPNAAHTRLIVTMNARSLAHAASLRMCTRAQKEIRELVTEMIRLCKEVSPLIFENMGPTCVSKGFCPEGSHSCGAAPTINEVMAVYKEYKQA